MKGPLLTNGWSTFSFRGNLRGMYLMSFPSNLFFQLTT